MRRIARMGGLLVAGLFALLLLAALGALAAFQFEGVRRHAAERLAALLSDERQEIRIGALEGASPLALHFRDIAVRDDRGPWLTVERLALRWSVLPLLGGRLQIDHVGIAGAVMSRPPAQAPPAAEAREPAGLPALDLPLAVTVAAFALHDLALGPAVAGVPARLAGTGSASFGGDARAARLALALARTDGTAGRAELRLDQGNGRAVTLAARIEEPAGGLLARLLELPGLPAVALRLTGEGPRSGWQGRLEAAAGATRVAGDLTLALAEGATVGFAGEIQTGNLLRTGVEPLDRGPVALEATLHWLPGERLELRQATLGAGAVQAALEGVFDWETQSVEAAASVSVADAELLAGWLAPLSAGTARAEAELSGRLQGGQALTLTAAGSFERLGGILGGGLDLAALAGDGAAWSLVAALDPGAGRLALESLRLEAGQLELAASGRVWPGEERADLTLSGRLAELAPLATAAGVAAEGHLLLDGHIAGTLDAWEAQFAAELDRVALGEPLLANLLGESFGLHGRLAQDEGALVIEQLELEAPALSLAVSGRIDAALDLAFRLALPEVSPLGAAIGLPLAGTLGAEGTLLGPPEDPSLVASLSAPALAIDGRPVGPVAGEATLLDMLDRPNGSLALELAQPVPASASASFALSADGGVALRDIAVEGAATRLAGDLRIGPAGGIDGRLQGRLGDLRAWQALHGLDLAGATSLDLRFESEAGQALLFRVEGGSLALDAAADTPTLEAERVLLEGRLENAWAAAPTLSATLEAGAVTGPGWSFERLQARAAGRLADLSLSLAGAGRVEGGGALSVSADGTAALAGAARTLRLARFEAELDGVPARLLAPARIAMTEQGWSVAGLDAAVGGGRLTIEGSLSPAAVDLAATIRALPLDAVSVFLPEDELAGSLDASLRLSGDPAQPQGRIELSLANLRDELGRAGEVAMTGRLAGPIADGRADLTVELESGADLSLRGRVDLPVAVSLAPPRLAFDPAGPLAGRLEGRLDLALLPELLDLAGDEFDGVVALAAELGGTWAVPRLAGEARLTGGRYENAVAGTVIEDVTATVRAERDRIVLESLSATDGGNGTVSGTGSMMLDAGRDFPFTVDLELADFTLLRRADAAVGVNGTARLEPVEGARLAGRLQVTSAELRIPEWGRDQIVALEVIEVNLPEGRPPRRAAAEAGEPRSPLPIHLDLRVRAPGQVFFRGRGLDSEWRGALQLGGTIDAPDPVGELRLVRGGLEVLGRQFTLEEGTVSFVGGGEIDPNLNILATAETADLVAQIRMTGPASAPSFALSSQPPLPPDEILSRILFGTSVGALTPAQALQLAQAAGELAGAPGPGAIVERLRRGTGLDVLDIETAGDEGPSLRAGTYLDEDVFLSVTQGLAAAERSVGVEVRVLPNVTLQTEVGTNAQSEIGVRWRYDY